MLIDEVIHLLEACQMSVQHYKKKSCKDINYQAFATQNSADSTPQEVKFLWTGMSLAKRPSLDKPPTSWLIFVSSFFPLPEHTVFLYTSGWLVTSQNK